MKTKEEDVDNLLEAVYFSIVCSTCTTELHDYSSGAELAEKAYAFGWRTVSAEQPYCVVCSAMKNL